MPHPEHAVEPGFGPETGLSGSAGVGGSDTDGLGFFTSVLNKIVGGAK
jgi:phosphoribosylformylglycinamidine synthase